MPERSDNTRFVHAAKAVHNENSATQPLAPPVYLTTVYAYEDTDQVDTVHEGQEPGYIYGRYALPNTRQLEQAMMELESAEAGLATTSATTGILATLLTMTAAGDRIVAGHNTYGGTRALLDSDLSRFNLQTTYVDLTDLQAVEDAMRLQPTPKLLWADTLSNPTLVTNDIPVLTEIAHEHGVPIVVDNTFATPFHFNPITCGADLVVHSLTKFMGGHHDVFGGVVLGPTERIEPIRRTAIRTGGTGAAFDTWLTLRGLRSAGVRLRQSSASALAIAMAIDGCQSIKRVHYPGLSGDPQHAAACKMFRNGFGSMLSIDFGDEQTMRQVVDRMELPRIAETLGGLMTTVVLPKLNYYRHLNPDQLAALGISPGLARFSIGIESTDDLIADFQQAIDG